MKKYKSIGLHIAKEQYCSTGLPLCESVVFNMEEEIWRDVIGYEGYYQVSSKGNIRSIGRFYLGNKSTPTKMPGKFISLKINKKKYVAVHLSVNGQRKMLLAHRLVAMAFIPNPENKPQVNHKNGIKNDNRVENLEWCTPKENDHHACANGLKATGERNGWHKLTNELILEIKGKYIPHKYTNKMLAEEYNMSYHEIQLINQGKRWKHVN